MTYETFILAFCLWREARSCSRIEIEAIACSIRNRVLKRFRGMNYGQVVTARAQYSSFPWINDKGEWIGDHNCLAYPDPDGPEWSRYELCMSIADEIISGSLADTVGGATHYHDKSLDANPPSWTKDPASKHVADVGAFRFWSAR